MGRWGHRALWEYTEKRIKSGENVVKKWVGCGQGSCKEGMRKFGE